MKYRIKESDGCYTVQHRVFLFWWEDTRSRNIPINHCIRDLGSQLTYSIAFYRIKYAVAWIQKEVKLNKGKETFKYHYL